VLQYVLLLQIPVTRGVWDDPGNPLTAVFKVMTPCLFYACALLFTRIYPATIVQHIASSEGFDSIPPAMHHNIMMHNPIAV
jgi:hypothetical protein